MLDTAVTNRVPKAGRNPARQPSAPPLRRDLGEDFAPRRRSVAPALDSLQDDEDYTPARASTGLRLRLRGGIPRSLIGRIIAGGAVLIALGASIASIWGLRSMLLSNPRLVLASSSAIQITGNSHLSRAQLLTVFGEDVDRNILTVPLAQRRAELEHLPWVEHATVMRLLPDHFRVAISERKPVAFVRQGSTIGLVDANGVLLDMASDEDAPTQPHYSFPVVTGISAQDPLSVRAARMKLFARFTADLGEQTKNISEVDLSSPEDVKALIPDNTSDILVHFGEDNFLHRYEVYQKNLPGWREKFPKMASVDMRYENKVVIEMQRGAEIPVSGQGETDAPKEAAKPAAKPATKPTLKARPTTKRPGAPSQSVSSTEVGGTQHLHTAFDVHPKPTPQAGPQ